MQIEKVIDQKDSYLVNDTTSVPKAEGNTDYKSVLEWIENGGKVIPFDELEETRKEKISQTKSKAQQLIVAQYPDYKQRNILMSGDDIAIADMNAFIEPIRIRSNEIESDINDCTTIEELNNVNTDF